MSRLFVQFSNLFKSFGSFDVLQDVSLSIHQRDLIALIGENGAGKTTLLKIIEGTVPVDSGSIKREASLRVGMLPQEIPALPPKLTARKYFEDEVLLKLENQMRQCLEDPSRLLEWERLHEEYDLLG